MNPPFWDGMPDPPTSMNWERRALWLAADCKRLEKALELIADHDCDGDRLGYKCDGCRTCIAINALEAINAR
jgi:hypothetical protein